MPRPSQTRSLAVLMNGLHVGQWTIANQGSQSFRYDRSWLEREGARPISLSLPLLPASDSHRGANVGNFFENLLPDSTEIRQRIQAQFGAASTTAFDLLTEIGRDCVGALQIASLDQEVTDVRQIQAEPLDERAIAEALRSAVARPPLGQPDDDAFRISIAGAQEKSAFLWHNDQWQRPHGTTPTSHIFKLPLGAVGNMRADFSTSVENEWLCRQIIHEFGLPIAACAVADFEDQHVLVVERFDRHLSRDGSWWIRQPQEDFCQVTATPPGLKYESDGGPGIETISDLLLGSRNSLADRRTFFKAQVLFWMLCAIDGHAKNFSVRIASYGRFELTPLYDVMSAYPILGGGAGQLAPQRARMAMAAVGKNRHYRWNEIHPRHWLSTANRIGLAATAEEDLVQLATDADAVIDRVASMLPADFPSEVSGPVFNGLAKKAAQILESLS